MSRRTLKPGDKITDIEKIHLLAMDVVEKENILLLWQEMDGDPKGCAFAYGKVISFSENLINIKYSSIRRASIDKNSPLYVFGQKYGCKNSNKILELTANRVTIPMPEEIVYVGDEFLQETDIIALDDEEKFLVQSTDIKKRPKKRMFVKVNFIYNKKKKLHGFLLYDLSPMGMGVVTEEVGDIEFGDKIEVVSIDNKPLETKIKGIVKSIRLTKENFFKIGFLFEKASKAYKDVE